MSLVDDVNAALSLYQTKWRALIAARQDKEVFEALRPTAVGWKVASRAHYRRLVAEIHTQADMIVEKWMNERWIAKVHLKDTKLQNGVEVIKIMERRPGSTDRLGLDHVDFYSSLTADHQKAILLAEPNLEWTEESNDVLTGYSWLSVWFEGTEAKIKSYTVLDIVAKELEELNGRIVEA